MRGRGRTHTGPSFKKHRRLLISPLYTMLYRMIDHVDHGTGEKNDA